jgi:amidase
VAKTDSELARRFRQAGFIFVGKTNTPELALSVTTEPLAYGATRNPWDPALSPGGSSGGSAAAVAAGLVPVAHGNDMGGSIRVPSSYCGLVGLKPSRARTSLGPDYGEFWGPLTHEHVLTRSVRDSAGVLDAIAGPALGDPYTAPPPRRPWKEELEHSPGTLRIGMLETPGGHEIHPDCQSAVAGCARQLEALGHRVESISIPALDEPRIGPWIMAAVARDLDRWGQVIGRPLTEEDVEPVNWMMAGLGRGMSMIEFMAESEAAWCWARAVQEACWGRGFDLLLTPTAPQPPPVLGWLAPNVPLPDLMARMGAATVFSMPFDVTGQPAISLPLHWNDAGLPIGVQLVAGAWREDQLFQVAAQLEEAMPRGERRPRIHA